MKKTLPLRKLLPAFLLAATLGLAACKKDNYSLPPETQTGAGTFGCKIDGKVWVPKGSDYSSGQNVTAYYQHIYPSANGYFFRLTATNDENYSPFSEFGIGGDSLKISPNVTYRIKNGHRGLFSASYRIGLEPINTYYIKDELTGEVYFTKFDETNQIASGTFWFDAKNINGEIIHVTEGRFDVKYTR